LLTGQTFIEFHQSGLAGVFLNFEKIFPCASGQFPICRTFTYEEDGFKNGKYFEMAITCQLCAVGRSRTGRKLVENRDNKIVFKKT